MVAKVIIGITTYNLEKYIKQALDSVLNQKTNFDFQILVVDDASIDGTQDIIIDYSKKYGDKVRYFFNNENKGSLCSSNFLFNHMKSKYISFLDGDDYWVDELKLQKQIDFLDSHKNYSMVGGNTILLRNGELSERIIHEGQVNKSFSWEDKVNGRCPFVHTSSLLLRNVVYKKGVPPDYIKAQDSNDNPVYRGEDIRFLHHLQKGNLYIFPDVLSVYRIHDGGLWSSSPATTKLLEGMIANLRYIDLFPSGFLTWKQTFISQYYDFLSHLAKGYTLTEREYDLFCYVLTLLKSKKISLKK